MEIAVDGVFGDEGAELARVLVLEAEELDGFFGAVFEAEVAEAEVAAKFEVAAWCFCG